MSADTPQIPSPENDPLHGNRASDLFRQAFATSDPQSERVGWTPPSPAQMARLLPHYQVSSLLGRGGMGAVYRGRQEALNRPVAIKLLPAELAATPGFVERFRREAQTLARLQHPGIVTIYDFGQTDPGHLYFVMEFVDGTDLYRIIEGPGLAPEQALEFTVQICEALHYAHGQGVVHRDIKPANVLVTRDGRAKLADFGLARPFSSLDGSSTAASGIAGTPDYMAPEQWAGKADHRADIYALGVMLYEMLTGTRPKGAFPMPSQRAKVDVRLDKVVVKAMRQEPESRYQQISELRLDVERIRTSKFSEDAPAKPAPAKVARRSKQRDAGEWVGWAIAATVITLIFAGVIAALIAPDTSPEPPLAGPEVPAVRDPEPTLPEPLTVPEVVPETVPDPVAAPPTVAVAVAVPVPGPVASAAVAPRPVLEAPSAPLPAMAPIPVPAPVPPAPPEESPLIQSFSAEAPNLMAWCLAPLEEEVPADIRQNLTYLREDLVDEGKTDPAASIDAYRAAYYLCEALIASLDERSRARVAAGYRSAQAEADKRVSNSQLDARRNYQMSWPQYHREESQRAALREKETNGANLKKARIPVDWSAVTERSRGNLDRLYRQFRAAMRG